MTKIQECAGYATKKSFTFFSKMRAVVRAIAWRSSNTQRTQRNCGERKTTGSYSAASAERCSIYTFPSE